MQVHKERKRPKSWSNLLIGFYRQVNRQSLIVSRRRPTSKGDTSWVLDRLAEVIERLRTARGFGAEPGTSKSSRRSRDPATSKSIGLVSAVNLDSGSVANAVELNLDHIGDGEELDLDRVEGEEDDDRESLSEFFVEGPLADPSVSDRLQYLVAKKEKAAMEVRVQFRIETNRKLPTAERLEAAGRVRRGMRLLKSATDSIFTEFCQSLGVLSDGLEACFDKKRLDLEMESCFGSLDREGCGVFNYPPLMPLSLKEPFGAVKIFSVYLGRKAFNTSHPKDMETSLEKTFGILTSPPPPVSLPDEELFHSRFRAIVKAALVGFQEEPFAPSSGKSCVELSAEGGGKRVAQYGIGADLEGIVRPKAIWSSGKIRVITIGSCQEYDRFQTVSAGLFRQVRKARWCAAGGSIDAWWKSVGKEWQEYSSGNLISGDLEAATDNLDGRLAEIVFEELAPRILREGETTLGLVERMKASCSRADLYQRKCQCPGNAIHGKSCYKFLGKQQRGQLMGSILSFPILCLITFATYAAFHPTYGKWMDDLPTIELRKRLWKIASCGVNGDDITFPDEWTHVIYFPIPKPCPRTANIPSGGGRTVKARWKVYACQSNWEKGVRIARGVVSRGKTLCNKRFFTINSEIFDREIGRLNVIRPTLLVAVCEQAFKAPMSLWREMIVSPLMGPRVRRLFKPEDVLFPDQPKSLGGLGTCLQSFHEFNPVRFLFLKRVREVPEFAALSEDNYSVGAIKTVRGVSSVHRVVEGPEQDPTIGKPVRIVTGWVTKKSAKALSRIRFGVSSNVMRWSTPVIKKFRRVEALKNARADARRLSLRDRFELYKEYRLEFEMSAAGLTYVDQVADPDILDWSRDPDAITLRIGGGEELELVDRFDAGRPAERQVLEAGIYDPVSKVLEGVKSDERAMNAPGKWAFGEVWGDPDISYATIDSTTSHSSWIDQIRPLPPICRGRDGFTKFLGEVDRGEVAFDGSSGLRDQFLDRFG